MHHGHSLCLALLQLGSDEVITSAQIALSRDHLDFRSRFESTELVLVTKLICLHGIECIQMYGQMGLNKGELRVNCLRSFT